MAVAASRVSVGRGKENWEQETTDAGPLADLTGPCRIPKSAGVLQTAG